MEKYVNKTLELFNEINKIPRGSGNIEEISNWLLKWGKDNNFEAIQDKVKNILIKVPATKGYEDKPILVLQGHMDMVCEKTPDSNHDFTKDPIKMLTEGEWLTADKTTLGADNGIALALAMILATEDDIKHPPLELLFTVDEETGLDGANYLQPGFLDGKVLLNIDSEDEGVFTVGCAGGEDTHIKHTYNTSIKYDAGLEIKAHNFAGGHSGVDILKKRANANKILARCLKLIQHKCDISISSFDGGTAHNAIPRDSIANISYKSQDKETINTIISSFEKDIINEFKTSEKNPKISTSEIEVKEGLDKDDSNHFTNLLIALPHGIKYMHAEIENLVETSNNLAKVTLENKKLEILMSGRSSTMSRLDEITQDIVSVAKLAGTWVDYGNRYPAWEPNMDSKLLERCVKVYKDTFGKEPIVEAIHAGLECGIIGSKYDGMDMISFGPTIENPHSPDEKMHLPSLTKIWKLMIALVESYLK